MLFVQLFWSFLRIGLFTFGGGYAMVALIQNEVVVRHAWLSVQDFTDILAISQMTPGPIGVNTATYTGYTVAMNAGYGTVAAIAASLLASMAVIMLPVLLMLLMMRLLSKYRDNKVVDVVFRVLRLVVVGLIAAAAVSLMTQESFGTPAMSRHFVVSVLIFGAVLFFSLFPFEKYRRERPSPIWLIVGSGVVGWLVYGL